MKKIITGLFITAVAFSMTTSTFAAYDVKEVYDSTNNSVSGIQTNGGVTITDNKTVVITKEAKLDGTSVSATDLASKIVYVNQERSGFDAAVKFMLADSPDEGYYRARFGNVGDTSYDDVYFVIGTPENSGDKMTVADAAEAYGRDKDDTSVIYYKKSFTMTTTCDRYSTYKSLKLIGEDGTTVLGAVAIGDSWKKTNFTGEGSLTVGVQVYNIPEQYKGLGVSLSTETAVAKEG